MPATFKRKGPGWLCEGANRVLRFEEKTAAARAWHHPAFATDGGNRHAQRLFFGPASRAEQTSLLYCTRTDPNFQLRGQKLDAPAPRHPISPWFCENVQ